MVLVVAVALADIALMFLVNLLVVEHLPNQHFRL
jgi:hypothetical protein